MIPGIFVQRIDWRGITVEISYEPEWMGSLTEAFGEPLAHLQVRTVSPERAALPITGTGYLPAQTELNTLYTNAAAIGNFDTSGNLYWSSAEGGDNTRSWYQNFSTGGQSDYGAKQSGMFVRCARR